MQSLKEYKSVMGNVLVLIPVKLLKIGCAPADRIEKMIYVTANYILKKCE